MRQLLYPNPEDEKHLRLAELSEECHQKVTQLAVKGKSIGFLRNKVRQHLSAEIDEIDKLVNGILSQPFNPKSW